MDDLSRLANMAESFSAIVVVGGIMFAIIQMRQTRQQRRELAAIELFRSFSRSAFTDAYQRVLHYPDGLTAEQLRNDIDSPFAFEWFQWLTVTLERLQDDSDLSAYEAHMEWQPSNLSSEI